LLTGCVKIETGGTVEEATESNEVRAKQIRSQWAEQIQSASPQDVAKLVKGEIDSVSAMYIRYGLKVADDWHHGNKSEGKDIEAVEMRRFVDGWVSTQKPILNAYEDNLEFGINRIQQSRVFRPETLGLLNQFIDQFYSNRSTVFYPNENADQYEAALVAAQRKTESLSRDLGQELDKY